MRAFFWVGAVGAILVGGCTEPAKSGTLGTDEMAGDFVANCDGSTCVLTAVFTVPGGTLLTYVHLDDADSARVTAGDLSVDLAELTVGEVVSYVGGLPALNANADFVFSLTREIDAGAPSSEVTLPPPFAVSGVNPANAYSRGSDALSVAWTGDTANDPMTLSVTGDCIEDYNADIEMDSGSLGIPAGALVSRVGSEVETCDLTLTLERMREGTVDPAFADGSVTAYQSRSVTVSAAP